MLNHPDDRGAAEAADYRDLDVEEAPTTEQVNKTAVQTLQVLGVIGIGVIIMIVIIMAGYQPAPEFHG
jgi:uncharacterized membrane protein